MHFEFESGPVKTPAKSECCPPRESAGCFSPAAPSEERQEAFITDCAISPQWRAYLKHHYLVYLNSTKRCQNAATLWDYRQQTHIRKLQEVWRVAQQCWSLNWWFICTTSSALKNNDITWQYQIFTVPVRGWGCSTYYRRVSSTWRLTPQFVTILSYLLTTTTKLWVTNTLTKCSRPASLFRLTGSFTLHRRWFSAVTTYAAISKAKQLWPSFTPLTFLQTVDAQQACAEEAV